MTSQDHREGRRRHWTAAHRSCRPKHRACRSGRLGSDLATASVSSWSYSASIGMSVSAGCSIEVCSFMISHRTSSADRCRVLDSWRGIANAADQRRSVESAMSRASVGEVSGSLPVIRDGGDHRHLQGFGDLIPSVRLALAYDDQTQVPAIVD